MSPSEDRISGLPDEILCHIISFLPSEQISLTSLLSKRWNRVWLAMPNADWISALPVEILCRILYLLPFKQIMATAFLSKRWRRIHTKMTDINLDDIPYLHDEMTLNYFYNRVVLFLHHIEHTLNTFTFVSAGPSETDLDIMLAHREVEHLNITFLNSSSFPTLIMPYSAFTMSTLVEVNLNGLTIDHLQIVGTNLPSLKILHFTNVHLLKLKFLFKLLSVSPLLEDLLLKNLQVTVKTFPDGAIESLKPFPKLLKVDISDSDLSCCLLPLKLFYNVEFLRTQVALQSLEEDLSATKFLNLTHLELSFEDKYYWNWLIEFIRGCPILQYLVIRKIGGGYGLLSDDDVQSWLYPQFVPECLSSQLQMFSFGNYGGKESDLQFTKYIIQNARVLRNVTIYRHNSSSNPPEEEEQKMIKELHLCQRGSDLCQLHFE
ncbi:FBD-associated F-box protein [Trifolium repens]|nr:FBD-associated F-box protein [Trifolium repens]